MLSLYVPRSPRAWGLLWKLQLKATRAKHRRVDNNEFRKADGPKVMQLHAPRAHYFDCSNFNYKYGKQNNVPKTANLSHSPRDTLYSKAKVEMIFTTSISSSEILNSWSLIGNLYVAGDRRLLETDKNRLHQTNPPQRQQPQSLSPTRGKRYKQHQTWSCAPLNSPTDKFAAPETSCITLRTK